MSVIVKGMEMPKNCGECFVGNRTICADDCPLIELPEKHGRLVDADNLAELLSKEKEKFVGEGNLFLCFAVGFAWGFIAKEPTVVEAERREE